MCVLGLRSAGRRRLVAALHQANIQLMLFVVVRSDGVADLGRVGPYGQTFHTGDILTYFLCR